MTCTRWWIRIRTVCGDTCTAHSVLDLAEQLKTTITGRVQPCDLIPFRSSLS